MHHRSALINSAVLLDCAEPGQGQQLDLAGTTLCTCQVNDRLVFAQVVRNVTNGATPARIVATGYAEGGALAKLAAVWAGAAFAGAQVRSINFGAPRVGGAR